MTELSTDDLLADAGLDTRPPLIYKRFRDALEPLTLAEQYAAVVELLDNHSYPTPADLKRILAPERGWQADWVLALAKDRASMTEAGKQAYDATQWQIQSQSETDARFSFRAHWEGVQQLNPETARRGLGAGSVAELVS